MRLRGVGGESSRHRFVVSLTVFYISNKGSRGVDRANRTSGVELQCKVAKPRVVKGSFSVFWLRKKSKVAGDKRFGCLKRPPNNG